MWRDKLPYDKAFSKVKEARPIICPNDGFVKQLKLFEEMGYKVDKESDKYKEFWKKLQKEMEEQFAAFDLNEED